MRMFLALGLAAGMFLAWLPPGGAQTLAQEGEAQAPRVSEPPISEPPVSEPRVSEPRVSEPRVSEPCVAGPDALGVSRTLEIDTIAGPRFGAPFKEQDILADGEVVLTFDDGPLRAYTQR